MRVMITLMALRALIIKLLHLTFLKLCAATYWLTNTMAVQRSCGSTVATLNTSSTKLRVSYVTCTTKHRTHFARQKHWVKGVRMRTEL